MLAIGNEIDDAGHGPPMTTSTEIELRAWLPSDGSSVFYYPHPDRGHGHADIVCRVTSSAGAVWYAAAERKLLSPTGFVMPDGVSIFLEGYIFRADDPLRWEAVPLESIMGYCRTVDGRSVVFHDIHAVAAYDEDGLRWRKSFNHLDILKIVAVDDEKIGIQANLDCDTLGECPTGLRLSDGEEMFGRSS
jgi:hypothetical protein